MTGGGSAEPLLVNVLGARTRDGSEGPGHRLLVLIHGYGADEHDLAPLAQLYDPDGNFFAVCPRGPCQQVTSKTSSAERPRSTS